ncbi:hypothetical protein SAMN04488109_6320 [Chryseolinea serpens]|uniref:Uncharacterized protein n=1 Tax=Chryseolinea serpens TaxID=947013 RepID=A0A1M5XAD9_9BACT|nr:hypothetical protein SAMN04488109_6320 [Chryseolinea serpens]
MKGCPNDWDGQVTAVNKMKNRPAFVRIRTKRWSGLMVYLNSTADKFTPLYGDFSSFFPFYRVSNYLCITNNVQPFKTREFQECLSCDTISNLQTLLPSGVLMVFCLKVSE